MICNDFQRLSKQNIYYYYLPSWLMLYTVESFSMYKQCTKNYTPL